MTKDEFIKTACSLGYCSRRQAEEYCIGKETFNDDDYIEVYRMVEERRFGKHHGQMLYGGGRTSKQYYGDGDEEANR